MLIKDRKRISSLLILVANKLENESDFLSKLEHFLSGENKLKKNDEINIKNDFIDIWPILQQQGIEGLNKVLLSLDEKQLIKIIQMNNLDTSKLSHKWKNKIKLIKLIKERAIDRTSKGDAFLDLGVLSKTD
jgi:hypothetical protein